VSLGRLCWFAYTYTKVPQSWPASTTPSRVQLKHGDTYSYKRLFTREKRYYWDPLTGIMKIDAVKSKQPFDVNSSLFLKVRQNLRDSFVDSKDGLCMDWVRFDGICFCFRDSYLKDDSR